MKKAQGNIAQMKYFAYHNRVVTSYRNIIPLGVAGRKDQIHQAASWVGPNANLSA